jgi:hypothetical protein
LTNRAQSRDDTYDDFGHECSVRAYEINRCADELEAAAVSPDSDVCVCGHDASSHGNDGTGHCGATRECRAGKCKQFRRDVDGGTSQALSDRQSQANQKEPTLDVRAEGQRETKTEGLPGSAIRADSDAPPSTPHRRWNIEEGEGGSLRICRGEHDKALGCEWETYVPEAK